MEFEVFEQNRNIVALEVKGLRGTLEKLWLCFVYAPPYYNEKATFSRILLACFLLMMENGSS